MRKPQALFADETLEQALRQLVLYGHSPDCPSSPTTASGCSDGSAATTSSTRSRSGLGSSTPEIEAGAKAAEFGADGDATLHAPTAPLSGFDLIELTVGADSPALGLRLDQVTWPAGCLVVAVTEGREVMAPRLDITLRVGERVVLLSPATSTTEAADPEAPL